MILIAGLGGLKAGSYVNEKFISPLINNKIASPTTPFITPTLAKGVVIVTSLYLGKKVIDKMVK